jgi:hypothetical protein
VDIPGVHALISILISLGENCVFSNHFKLVLGWNIEHVLAAKLRIHVRRFAEEIAAMAEKKLAERKERLEQIEKMNREAEERETSDDDQQQQQKKKFREVTPQAKLEGDRDEKMDNIEGYLGDDDARYIFKRVNDYQWLLIQLRALLLCYALFDEFLQSQNQPIVANAGMEPNNLEWPVVCCSFFFHFDLVSGLLFDMIFFVYSI